MTSKTWLRAGIPALLAAICAAGPALAAPTINKGDTAWMMTATVLVLVMTVPGLALFYAGMVRAKNTLSVLMHVMYTVCIVFTIWMLYGYSLTFTGGGDFIGGLSKAFMAGLTPETPAATFTVGVAIPEPVYVVFQMTFAAITAALIVGAFAERMKFSALALFIPLWITFVYFPIAHMVWYWSGPDAIADAAKALAAAGADVALKAKAQEALDAVLADGGYLFKAGAIDFAGGTVVHINSGIAGLVGAIMVGKRVGHGKDLMPPHSLPLTFTGATLLWFGWFGFNAGSNLEAAGGAVIAMTNTFIATATAALGWMIIEWITKGRPSLLGIASGAIAGLVAVTPASGFAGAMGALVLGFIAGIVCYLLLHHGEECAGLRRCARRLRRPLHRRHHRRAVDRNPGQPRARRHRHLRLCHQQGRRLRPQCADDLPVQGGDHHAAVVGHRFGDPLQDRRPDRRSARPGRQGARRPRHHRPRRTRLQLIGVSSPPIRKCQGPGQNRGPVCFAGTGCRWLIGP